MKHEIGQNFQWILLCVGDKSAQLLVLLLFHITHWHASFQFSQNFVWVHSLLAHPNMRCKDLCLERISTTHVKSRISQMDIKMTWLQIEVVLPINLCGMYIAAIYGNFISNRFFFILKINTNAADYGKGFSYIILLCNLIKRVIMNNILLWKIYFYMVTYGSLFFCILVNCLH